MRILRIALENLNSLRGLHEVRLDTEPLDGAGLFAITGPTGAGKSTLLDAVTLALYGRAARYGSAPSPADVMSRHCGSCSAEVDFEVAGARYRAVWNLRRAREKPDGNVQPAQRYIYDAQDRPLTQKIGESERKIEQLIGLDYPRFLRSVLLAQGEFAQFLKAKPTERAELLESLTGTDIYSELGVLAHTTFADARNRMQHAEMQLAQISVMEPSERTELEIRLAATVRELRAIEAELKKGTEVIERIGRLREAQRQENEASAELARIKREAAERETDRDRYERHLRVEPALEQITRFDSAHAHAAAAAAERDRAANALRAARDQLHHSAALHAAVIERDLREATSAETVASDAVRQAEQHIVKVEKELESRRADQPLFNVYTEITSAVSTLREARSALASRHTEWVETCGRSEDATADLDQTAAEAMIATARSTAEQQIAAAQTARAAAQELARLARHHLRSAQLVADLTQHRTHLEPGQPCPLCGATDHPWAEQLPDEPTLADLAAILEEHEETVRRSEDELRRVTAAQKQLDSAAEALVGAIGARDRAVATVSQTLTGFALDLPAAGEETSFLTDLRARASRYRELTDERSAAETRLRDARAERERHQRTIAELTEAATEPGQATEALDETNSPSDGSARESSSESSAGSTSLSDARTGFRSALQQLHTAEAIAEKRAEDAQHATRNAEAEQQRLLPLVTAAGFDTVAAMRAARMPEAEAKSFTQWLRTIEKRQQSAEVLLERAGAEVRTLEEAGTPRGDDAEAAQRAQDERTDRRDTLIEDRTSITRTLDDDTKNRSLREQRAQELDEIKKEHTVWSELSRLIGSHDGSKFRSFAQSISLDVLVRHANRHLAQLSDRYRMVRDGSAELALQIEDLHQAATRRPMESLSGGESFLASLALALGLSDLAGRSVRIDSLFIDEGFGSLDPDTLDIAISALESLRQNRKTVGVISHVGLLKERIGTQIVVEKLAGGVSRLRVVG
ncbi:MAG: hypothetical protein EA403_14410 [Spirochaetaceae bacterium]|nr:MAG: hypothetical protein EA403_14410 [Spirochaetaceae bacterium]